MKKQSSVFARLFGLLWLAPLFFSFSLSAQQSHHPKDAVYNYSPAGEEGADLFIPPPTSDNLNVVSASVQWKQKASLIRVPAATPYKPKRAVMTESSKARAVKL